MGVVQLQIPAVKTDEIDMQRAFYGVHSQRYELVADNVYLGWCGGEMDIFGMRKSGFIDEVEIKLSASDFKADFKKTVRVSCEPYTPDPEFNTCSFKYCAKCHGSGVNEQTGAPCGNWSRWGEQTSIKIPKHEALKDGRHSCNYFSFFLPVELVDKCEIPDYAGLYTFDPTQRNQWGVKEVKKAPRLHSRKISEHNKYSTARKMHFRYWDMMMREGRE
jgi:hypothetical protein